MKRRSPGDHPRQLFLLAPVAAVAALVLMGSVAGLPALHRVVSHFSPGWVAVAAGGQVLAIAAYVLAYRHAVAADAGPRLPVSLTARLVTAGFSAFLVGGGFSMDRWALKDLFEDDTTATVRVAALGALEWGLLAPAACLAAVALLVEGGAARSLLLSWVIGVPVGFALALPLATPDRARRLQEEDRRWRRGLGALLGGVAILRRLAARPGESWPALLGITVYWAADVASLYAGLRAFGTVVPADRVLVAYASGYALSRRSLPLGGAGITEVLLVLALTWVRVPLASALAGVTVYRGLNLLVPSLPAALTRARLHPALRRARPEGVP